MSPERIETLCDGVFAIAMPLLVFSLTVPLFDGGSGTNDEPTGFNAIEFYSYGLGFLGLGIYWMIHHTIFDHIRRSDGVFVWLNIVFLALRPWCLTGLMCSTRISRTRTGEGSTSSS